jgi:UDP-N-acetylglucosamine acyltransferase
MKIHPTAVVDPDARLASSVTVGPYTVIGPGVEIGEDSEIMSHVLIHSRVTLGGQCRVFPYAAIGCEPQDMKFAGEKTGVVIGDRVTIREFVTVHRATGEGDTTVGDDSYLMNYVHVAHNCRIGRNVILANNLAMAGHATVGDGATISAMVAIHQFARIGTHAFIGGYSRVSKDMPPYMLGEGSVDFNLHGPNVIGLKRKGFSQDTISALKEAYRLIFRNHRPLQEVLAEAENKYADVNEIRILVDFIRQSQRGVYR